MGWEAWKATKEREVDTQFLQSHGILHGNWRIECAKATGVIRSPCTG